MQAIREVISRLNNTQMGSTSEISFEHKVQANGKEYVKEIKKISFDGEIFCQLCERERTTQELSNEEDLKIKRAMGPRKYDIFHNQSIVTDAELLNASFEGLPPHIKLFATSSTVCFLSFGLVSTACSTTGSSSSTV